MYGVFPERLDFHDKHGHGPLETVKTPGWDIKKIPELVLL